MESTGAVVNNYNVIEDDNIPDGKAFIYEITAKNGDVTKLIDILSSDEHVKYISNAFVTSHQQEIGVTPFVVLQFEENVTEEQKSNLYEKFNVELVKSIWYEKVRIPDGGDVFAIANAIHESGLVTCSSPDFF